MKKQFPILMILLFLLGACAKSEERPYDTPAPSDVLEDSEGINVFATLFSEGPSARFLRVAGEIDYLIVNPSVTDAVPDGTRVLASLQEESEYPVDKNLYKSAVSILWMEALEELETVQRAASLAQPDLSFFGEPMQIIFDWITTAEAGHLTVHYRIRQSGSVQHKFELRPFGAGNDFALYHDTQGDTGEEPAEGVLCFRLSPEPAAGDSIYLHYLDYSGKVKTLVLVYRNGS